MLTYGTIAAGAPSSMAPMTRHLLTQTVPREVADLSRYYTQGMEVGENEAMPRRDMHPMVAEKLGIDPDKPVTADQINALLAGRRADGEKIEGKTYSEAREYTDPKTGEVKEKVPLGAVDFCLTPDKTVSVAWAFGTPAEQAAIYQAHRDAAEATMRFVELEVAKAGIGKGGKDGYDQGHLAWISFDHFTSRPTLWVAREENGERITESVPVQVAGDPDLHTHFTVTNAVICENGRVGSLDLNRLEGFVKTAGALYQAHIAQNLRDLGAEVVLDRDTGSARLTAIPDRVREHYSKRSTNGEQAAREYAKGQGLDWDSLSAERRAGLLKASVQGTPKGLDEETLGKLKKDDMADFAEWRRQADEIGWKHETVMNRQGPKMELTPEQRHDMAHPVATEWLEKDLNSRAVISEHDVRTAAARSLIHAGIADHTDIDGVVRQMQEKGVTQHGEQTTLIFGQESGKNHRSVTTALHESDEKEFISRARAAAADRSAALNHDRLSAAVERSGLDFSSEHGEKQLKAIHDIGEGSKLEILIGAAGAGKTTLLQPLVSAWQEDGRQVHGIALAWRQADDLTDAGIARGDAKAISVFFKSVQKGETVLTDKSVVVVDELSLLGTRDGLSLLRLRDKHDFKLVMIGDDKQCASINAGPIIDLSRKALGNEVIPEILTTVRQQTEREREIADLFRNGRAAEAIAMKREDKTVELVPGGYRETAERTAALIMERRKANQHDPSYTITVSSPTNSDAHRLSLAIRDKRREAGELGKDLVKIKAADRDGNGYEMKIAAGDRVRLYHSVAAQGQRGGSIGRNGSVLDVLDADKGGIKVRNSDGNEGYLPWKSLTRDGKVRLAYGEVMTTHTAQGSTSTEHIYAMPAGSKLVNAGSAYSSGTRHKRASFMLVSEGAERAHVSAQRSVNDPRPIKSADLWANLSKNLSNQRKKVLATDFLETAFDLKRETTRTFQQAMQPVELRAQRGLEPTTVHNRLQQRREEIAIRDLPNALAQSRRDLQPVVDRLQGVGPTVHQAVERGVERAVRTAVLQGTSALAAEHATPKQTVVRERLHRMAQDISQDRIDAVKQSVSLTKLVSETVALDKNGKGLCPFHEEKTPSFQVNEKKGCFHCYGCGCHGDAISWLRETRGMTFRQAIDHLGGSSQGLPDYQIQKAPGKEVAPTWVAVQPIPEGVPPLVRSNGWTAAVYNPRAEERGLERTSKAYMPAHVAEYQDAKGRQMGYVLRVEMSDGGKFTPQVTWAIPANAPKDADPAAVGRWTLTPMQGPRPLYRGEELEKHPGREVVMVMGEKKCDALQKKLGDSATVVSWAGGDNGRHQTDFSSLKGRAVTIWPDADPGGKAAAIGERDKRGEHKKGVAEYIREAGATSVKVIIPPAGVEKGWDAGDMIKAGASRDAVRSFVESRAVSPEKARIEFGQGQARSITPSIGQERRAPKQGLSISL